MLINNALICQQIKRSGFLCKWLEKNIYPGHPLRWHRKISKNHIHWAFRESVFHLIKISRFIHLTIRAFIGNNYDQRVGAVQREITGRRETQGKTDAPALGPRVPKKIKFPLVYWN